ncbi:hypothetical protein [Nannocystis radixulma]|uniref:Lipoprotein n=1 Tax=Nannocystis radixulma TaxID=2995305 RepID=A0ABT5AXW8_9BACT|nr:hypothetical protein [Nannocystis radixulma]MDC0666694.1 hypothetical protein [Nannocystis radixulma]
MTLDLSFCCLPIRITLVAVWLAACGPGKSDTTDTTDSTDTSTSEAPTTAGTTTGTTTEATPTSTGGTIENCADAKTEAECAMATEVDLDQGLGCRWGAVLVPTFPDGGDACSLEPKGGVCVLASFNEGGPACFGFFREVEGGGIELTSFDCGDPADESWEMCFGAPMGSPAEGACACLNPDG